MVINEELLSKMINLSLTNSNLENLKKLKNIDRIDKNNFNEALTAFYNEEISFSDVVEILNNNQELLEVAKKRNMYYSKSSTGKILFKEKRLITDFFIKPKIKIQNEVSYKDTDNLNNELDKIKKEYLSNDHPFSEEESDFFFSINGELPGILIEDIELSSALYNFESFSDYELLNPETEINPENWLRFHNELLNFMDAIVKRTIHY